MADATSFLHVSPVIPVVTIDDPQHAVPVARALPTAVSASSNSPTVGEVMMVLEHGLNAMKFFPAGPAGGPDYLAAIGAPIPQVQFCPTGGVSLNSAPGYLALPNVSCVGGSWLTPKAALESNDWGQITKLAREAAGLGRD